MMVTDAKTLTVKEKELSSDNLLRKKYVLEKIQRKILDSNKINFSIPNEIKFLLTT